jgi:hypothetical protein
MGIDPLNFRDSTTELDRAVRVEFGGECVMRRDWHGSHHPRTDPYNRNHDPNNVSHSHYFRLPLV